MQNVKFHPWIGSQYHSDNRFGARILLLGISHHGDASELHPGVTSEVVERLARGQRSAHSRFFSTLSKFLLNANRNKWLTDAERAEVWNHVAFYNFVQETVGDSAGNAPKPHMWAGGATPFLEVLNALQPDIVVVIGATLAPRLPAIPPAIHVCKVKHPAGGFAYDVWNGVLQESLRQVQQRKLVALNPA